MIQILTKNNGADYKGEGIVLNSLHTPQSLDEFTVNIIDLSSSTIWRNQNSSNNSINEIKDFESISQMIQNSKKTKILILLPQNSEYKYWSIQGKYQYEIDLKDMINELKGILSSLCAFLYEINLVYENTSTRLMDDKVKAAFYFKRVSDEQILLRSEGSDKPTTVMLYENIMASTVSIPGYKELMELLTVLHLVQTKQVMPVWFEEVRMFDDNEQFKIIEENHNIINKANENISAATKKIDENNEYKSILYTNGDELVRVVFKILETMLGCDLSQFEDKKAEDFLFEIGEIVFIGEIKGVSHNVKNENVSQLDVHYQGYLDENSDKSEEQIKAILIINHQKNKALRDREPVHENQIKLACRNGSLIVETTMLLKLFEQYVAGNKSRDDCINLLTTKTGILII